MKGILELIGMKSILKVYVVLASALFIAKIYTGLDWSSWINGALIGYLYRIWIGDDNA